MPKEFVTIASFDTALAANVFRASLEAQGIPAFLENERTVETQWLWSNAVGGVRLLAPAGDSERALAILAAARDEHAVDAATDEAPLESYEADESEDVAAVDGDSAAAEATPRERDAFQAFKLALFGLLLCPLQLFVPYYIARVLLNPMPMRARYHVCVLAAAVIVLPYALSGSVIAYLLFMER